MYFDVSNLSATECYQSLVAAVVPRPIAWISSKSSAEVVNLAPYSFFTVASCHPPVLSVTQVLPRNLAHKNTLQNLMQTKECVVNIVSANQVEKMNQSCASYAPEISEFIAADVESIDSQFVGVPGVAGSLVRYECRLREVINISEQAMGGAIMLLDVIAIFADDRCVEEGKIVSHLVDAVGKMGGDGYTTTRDMFSLSRPVI